MYLVICSDNDKVDLSDYNGLNWDRILFGPFKNKYDAEEWVDNHCGKKYWNIIQLNEQAT